MIDHTVYVKLVIDHLGDETPSLDTLCANIDAIQTLTKATNQSQFTIQAGNETTLANADAHTFKGKCGYCD